MRGEDQKQTAMYSYVTLTQRMPAQHPARLLRALADRALARLDGEFEKLYAATGRPSIAPERLLRPMLLMVLYSIRPPPAPVLHPSDQDLSLGAPGSGNKGALLLRDKMESTTDPEARLYKKSKADKSVPAYMGHALIENRNGLAVAAEATEAGNAAERASALAMLDRAVAPKQERDAELEITLGADTDRKSVV